MRVLWFTNVPLPEMRRVRMRGPVSYGGHWMKELLGYLGSRNDIKLGVATAFPDMQDADFEVDGVRYFVVRQPRRLHTFAMRGKDLEKCADIVRRFAPDIVHVHGSERFYGMLKVLKKMDVPMLVSIQGLLGPCSKFRNYFGSLTLGDIVVATRLLELPFRTGLPWQYYYISKGARREASILDAADGFLGRTGWDYAHVTSRNRTASYFQVGEIMRRPFYDKRWHVGNCERHSLIFTNAGLPLRGTEDVLSSLALLKTDYPDIKLRLAGTISDRSGYGFYLRSRIRRLGLGGNVELLGHLDVDRICQELLRANVFVLSSYIENSPNSLAEAMLLGMPCVATSTGGIPDIIDHERNGLLYSPGDVPLLVYRIRALFDNDSLASDLGNAAHENARVRHDPTVVVNQLMDAYQATLKVGHST